jgi:hypothetical protein
LCLEKGKQGKEGENCIMRIFMNCTPKKSTVCYYIREDEMGRTCNSYGEKKCIRYFGGRFEVYTLLGRHSPIFGDNINMNLKEIW